MTPPAVKSRHLSAAGLVRGMAMLFYLLVALIVLGDIGEKMHWQGRFAASLGLVGWAYATPARNRIDLWLWLASLLAFIAALLIMLSPGLAQALPDRAEIVLGMAAAATLVSAILANVGFFVRDRRRRRAALKTQYPSTVERAAGGF